MSHMVSGPCCSALHCDSVSSPSVQTLSRVRSFHLLASSAQQMGAQDQQNQAIAPSDEHVKGVPDSEASNGPLRTGMGDSSDFDRGGGMRLSVAQLLSEV